MMRLVHCCIRPFVFLILIVLTACGTTSALNENENTTGSSERAPEPVVPKVTAVNITNPEPLLTVGGSVQLNADVTVNGDASSAVVWSSSDDSIITVSDEGVLTAGTTTGVATVEAQSVFDPQQSARYDVRVVDGWLRTFTSEKLSFSNVAVDDEGYSVVVGSEQVGLSDSKRRVDFFTADGQKEWTSDGRRRNSVSPQAVTFESAGDVVLVQEVFSDGSATLEVLRLDRQDGSVKNRLEIIDTLDVYARDLTVASDGALLISGNKESVATVWEIDPVAFTVTREFEPRPAAADDNITHSLTFDAAGRTIVTINQSQGVDVAALDSDAKISVREISDKDGNPYVLKDGFGTVTPSMSYGADGGLALAVSVLDSSLVDNKFKYESFANVWFYPKEPLTSQPSAMSQIVDLDALEPNAVASVDVVGIHATSDGGFIVAGGLYATDGQDSTNVAIDGKRDWTQAQGYVQKYSASGDLLWTRPMNEEILALDIDSAGRVHFVAQSHVDRDERDNVVIDEQRVQVYLPSDLEP